jgi:hypothetical protein
MSEVYVGTALTKTMCRAATTCLLLVSLCLTNRDGDAQPQMMIEKMD